MTVSGCRRLRCPDALCVALLTLATALPHGWAAEKAPWTDAVATAGNARVKVHAFAMKPFAEPVQYVTVVPAGKPVRNLPVLLLLHGLGGDPVSWLELGRIVDRLDRALKRGRLPACLVVIPAGGDGYWADWPDGQHPYASLVLRVLDHARKQHATAKGARKTAIVGISMGGFGALSLGLMHPKRFGFVAGLSATDLEIAVRDGPIRKVYRQVLGDPPANSALKAINPHHLVRAGRGRPHQRFAISFGSREPGKFSKGGARLTAALRARGLSVVQLEVAGGRHGWASTWAKAHPWWIGQLGRYWRPRVKSASKP